MAVQLTYLPIWNDSDVVDRFNAYLYDMEIHQDKMLFSEYADIRDCLDDFAYKHFDIDLHDYTEEDFEYIPEGYYTFKDGKVVMIDKSEAIEHITNTVDRTATLSWILDETNVPLSPEVKFVLEALATWGSNVWITTVTAVENSTGYHATINVGDDLMGYYLDTQITVDTVDGKTSVSLARPYTQRVYEYIANKGIEPKDMPKVLEKARELIKLHDLQTVISELSTEGGTEQVYLDLEFRVEQLDNRVSEVTHALYQYLKTIGY